MSSLPSCPIHFLVLGSTFAHAESVPLLQIPPLTPREVDLGSSPHVTCFSFRPNIETPPMRATFPSVVDLLKVSPSSFFFHLGIDHSSSSLRYFLSAVHYRQFPFLLRLLVSHPMDTLIRFGSCYETDTLSGLYAPLLRSFTVHGRDLPLTSLWSHTPPLQIRLLSRRLGDGIAETPARFRRSPSLRCAPEPALSVSPNTITVTSE